MVSTEWYSDTERHKYIVTGNTSPNFFLLQIQPLSDPYFQIDKHATVKHAILGTNPDISCCVILFRQRTPHKKNNDLFN
jgi:hypothetical protein